VASIEHIQREQFEHCIERAHEFDDAGRMPMDEWVERKGTGFCLTDLLWRIRRNIEQADLASADSLTDGEAAKHMSDAVNLGLLALSLLSSDSKEGDDGR